MERNWCHALLRLILTISTLLALIEYVLFYVLPFEFLIPDHLVYACKLANFRFALGATAAQYPIRLYFHSFREERFRISSSTDTRTLIASEIVSRAIHMLLQLFLHDDAERRLIELDSGSTSLGIGTEYA